MFPLANVEEKTSNYVADGDVIEQECEQCKKCSDYANFKMCRVCVYSPILSWKSKKGVLFLEIK